MKYIRTKKQIIDLDIMEKEYAFAGSLSRENYVRDNAIKQADAIDKLCDCYILVGNDNHIPCNKLPYNYYQTLARGYGLEDFVVYGAIWTDKGLIYVAKMNDKGELELL